jgi:hypothetical protein
MSFGKLYPAVFPVFGIFFCFKEGVQGEMVHLVKRITSQSVNSGDVYGSAILF